MHERGIGEEVVNLAERVSASAISRLRGPMRSGRRSMIRSPGLCQDLHVNLEARIVTGDQERESHWARIAEHCFDDVIPAWRLYLKTSRNTARARNGPGPSGCGCRLT